MVQGVRSDTETLSRKYALNTRTRHGDLDRFHSRMEPSRLQNLMYQFSGAIQKGIMVYGEWLKMGTFAGEVEVSITPLMGT